jgi:sugar-specific transcriptional regulator TrmB
MLDSILQNIGLNEKEGRVFLEVLGHGEQPASAIAKLMGMPRNTTRFVMDRLVERGLVKKKVVGNGQFYSAEEPESLIHILEKKRIDENARIDRQIADLKGVMAELETRLKTERSKPKVTFYEGDEGLMSAYDDTLGSSETIRSFACYDMMIEKLNDYFKSYFERRVKNRIPIRWIHPDTPRDIEEAKRDKKEMREGHLIPHGQYYFTPEIQLYDGKLNITSLRERLGIIIESRELYDALAVAFELAWKEAARLDLGKKEEGQKPKKAGRREGRLR